MIPAAPARVLRLRGVRLLWTPRVLLTALLTSLVIGVLVAVELLLGRSSIGPAEVWQTLQGRGSAAQEYAVYTLRMPRALTAVLVGTALGAAGAAFQTLVRNPLGSPDVIGFTTGSATGALLGLMLLGGGQLLVAGCSVAGGLGVAALVYGLSRNDGVHGYRLVLLGIGISAVLTSVNSWLIVRAELADALAAQVWLTGTLAARGWEHVIPLLVVVLCCLPLLALLGRSLALWGLGPDTAASLGLRPERVRLAVIALSVVLVATATTATGPIAFVALVAPHVNRLISRAPQAGVVGSALTGAALLLAGDLLAQQLANGALPVGVVTSSLGGTYLALLLIREWRSGRG